MDTALQCGNGPRENPLPGFVVITQPGVLVDYLRRVRRGSFRIVYQPRSGAPEQHFDAVCRILAEVGDTVLVVDEVWHYTKANYLPEAFGKFVRAGRHYGITLLWMAQCMPDVSKVLRRCTNQWYVFRLQDPADVEQLTGRLPPEALAQVPRLPDWTCIHRDAHFNWRVIPPSRRA